MPIDPRKESGRRGEALAAAFLVTKGFRVIAENWQCRLGEIDLIVKRGEEIRFVEVKLRFSEMFGQPEEAVTRRKLSHIRRTAESWLSRQSPIPTQYQMDVVAILALPGKEPDIRWIEAVF
jgi:putative endonuclease